MKYSILFDKNADKQLRKIDITQQRIIVNWLVNNLENTYNPRIFGKSLKGNLKDYWRYRVGDYRIIAEINDDEVKILIIEIGHRKIFIKSSDWKNRGDRHLYSLVKRKADLKVIDTKLEI